MPKNKATQKKTTTSKTTRRKASLPSNKANPKSQPRQKSCKVKIDKLYHELKLTLKNEQDTKKKAAAKMTADLTKLKATLKTLKKKSAETQKKNKGKATATAKNQIKKALERCKLTEKKIAETQKVIETTKNHMLDIKATLQMLTAEAKNIAAFRKAWKTGTTTAPATHTKQTTAKPKKQPTQPQTVAAQAPQPKTTKTINETSNQALESDAEADHKLLETATLKAVDG